MNLDLLSLAAHVFGALTYAGLFLRDRRYYWGLVVCFAVEVLQWGLNLGDPEFRDFIWGSGTLAVVFGLVRFSERLTSTE